MRIQIVCVVLNHIGHASIIPCWDANVFKSLPRDTVTSLISKVRYLQIYLQFYHEQMYYDLCTLDIGARRNIEAFVQRHKCSYHFFVSCIELIESFLPAKSPEIRFDLFYQRGTSTGFLGVVNS